MNYDVIQTAKIQKIASLIKNKYKTDDIEAIKMLYESMTYQALEDTCTGLYLRSAVSLFGLFVLEKEHGTWEI